MAEKKNLYPQMTAPSAPPHHLPEMGNDFFQHRGPPPTYEESQKHNSTQSRPAPPTYFSTVGNSMMQMHGTPQNYQYSGYAAQPTINYQQQGTSMPMNSFPNSGQTSYPGGYNVLEFDAGARFKGKGGALVAVPPPPPGCAPTPAQIAAMQGQPVIVKKKKNSFF